MASFSKVGDKWRAFVRVKGHPASSSYHTSKAEARAWAERTEAELRGTPAGLNTASLSVAWLVAEYRRIREAAGRPVSRLSNQHYMLESLDRSLGREPLASLTPARMVEWAKQRRREGAGGYTVLMDLSQLGSVVRHVAAFRGVSLPDVVGPARIVLSTHQLIDGAVRRERRVTEDEVEALCRYFLDRDRPVIADAIRLLVITGLRRGELCSMRWADVDADERAVTIRLRKHPRRSRAKDTKLPLLGEAFEIVQRQPKTGERVFNLHPQTLSKSFLDACRAVGVPDCRLHDLRHEASSRLRELGFDTAERAGILGHTSAINLSYTHVSTASLHQKYETALGTPQRPAPSRKSSRRRASSGAARRATSGSGASRS